MADRSVTPAAELIRHPRDLVKISLVHHVVQQSANHPNEDVSGSLVLTASHLIFQEPSGRRETWLGFHLIQSVTRLPSESRGHPLAIRCKHFLRVTFIVPSPADCSSVMETITALAQPAAYDYLFAFCYPLPKQQSGWGLYKPQMEFVRMGLPNSFWTDSHLNKSYGLCATYPSVLFFPAACSDDVIEGSAKFRSKGRLPTLSYFYEPKGTSLCRCSQPLVGLKKRSQEDEELIDAIAKTTPDKPKLYIIDVRPRVNAFGNRIAGKGFEDEGTYKCAEFFFIGIQNIHVMRESLEKLLEAAESPKMSSFWSGLDSSGWFSHIKDILDASVFIANALYSKGRSVVVHCSDGWDRTSQTCSLAEMMIDPYYRTLHGFMILLEREWLSFGHKFTERLGLLSTTESRDVSPVFSQFLDCTWQMKQQFPTAFQFNEHFLVTLHHQVYLCQFGTFIGCCERQRKQVLKLHKRTASLWDYILEKTHLFIDPLYDPSSSDILLPNTDMRRLKFWQGLYCQSSSAVLHRESLQDVVTSMSNETKALDEHIEYLEKVLSDAKAKLPASDSSDTEVRKGVDPVIKMPASWACPRFKLQCTCGKPFSYTERRLICQHCGRLTCDECLRGKYLCPWSPLSNAQPACQPCRKQMDKQRE